MYVSYAPIQMSAFVNLIQAREKRVTPACLAESYDRIADQAQRKTEKKIQEKIHTGEKSIIDQRGFQHRNGDEA